MSCYFCPKVIFSLYFLFKILNIFTLQHTLYVKKALILTFNTGFRIQPFVKGILILWYLRGNGESPSPWGRYQNSILARDLWGTILLESKVKNCENKWEAVTPRHFILFTVFQTLCWYQTLTLAIDKLEL